MFATGRLSSLRTSCPRIGFVAAMSMHSAAVTSGNTGNAVAACLAVSRTGDVAVDASQTAPVLERPPTSGSTLRTLVLNRPKALNALNLSMVEALHSRISVLDDAPGVDAILLSAVPGRAFCAGGDIRSLYDAGVDGDPEPLANYFRAEYSMDNTIGNLKNACLISLLDGIVMGGGVGLSIHGRFRIATENTLLAMPENAIGLFPDCAVSYVLAKLPGGLGTYMALTGARLKGSDAFAAGLATHYVPSHMVPDLTDRLGTVNASSTGAISRAIAEYADAEPIPPIDHIDVIDECFANPDGSISSLTAEVIVERLKNASENRGEADSAFARETLETLLKCCPMSVKVSLESMKRSKSMSSLSEALQIDFRLGVRMSQRSDFYVGVKSAIVTKDRNPKWSPSHLSDVTDSEVNAMFEPLANDTEVAELELPSRAGHARM